MDQIYGVKMPHTGCGVCFWAGLNCWDIMSQKVDEKYSLDNMSQMEGGRIVSPFFVDDMSGFGEDEQSVHFYVRLGCSVTVDVVYMGRKIQ